MQVVEIVAKEISVITAFSLKELGYLNTVLNNMEMLYDESNVAHQEAREYLLNVLNPNVKELLKEHGIATD